MTEVLIRHIMANRLYPGGGEARLVETHISWVILTDSFAFKIKKPVQYAFLDFSTLDRRRHFCREEYRLNQRLAADMYLGVLPVSEEGIGPTDKPVVDYAVHMKRMDNRREMDRLLARNEVSATDMENLAGLLAGFHHKHRLMDERAYRVESDWQDFSGLFPLEEDLIRLTAGTFTGFDRWKAGVKDFLDRHSDRLVQRARHGFWVDGHGDLHSRNIFLPQNAGPVVFDCLEFNPHFRRMDVLNELAFLCMDLEFYGRADLSESFLQAYTRRWACLENAEDALLLVYFKAYRANVRLKVTLLQLRQHPGDAVLSSNARQYWALMDAYGKVLM